VGVEAGIHPPQSDQAAREEAGAYQENDAEGELAGNEEISEMPMADID
jgi:hypothetical protein